MAKKLKQGDLICISFNDHCKTVGGVNSPLESKVVGWFIQETPTHILLASWVADGQLISDNTDSYGIQKHPGLKTYKLKDPLKK